MINEQLLNYISQSLASGVPKENIKSSLMSSGWGEQDIETGFLTVNQQSSNNIKISEQQSFTPQEVGGELMDRPNSVKYFEVLMYSSIVLSIFASVFQYSKYITSTKSFYVLLSPLISIILSILFTYFAARKKANWARQVLLVLFIIGLPSLFSVFSLFFIKSVNLGLTFISGLLILIQMALKVGALYFIFSRPSNEWFSPQLVKSASNPNGSNITNNISTVWTKTIPRTNIGFMIISAILVFGVDLSIAPPGSSLAFFWYIMVGIFAVFLVLFCIENFIFKVKFANTTSNLDPSIATIVISRNVIFLLNFIPFVQLLGLMIIVPFGIGYAITYTGLIIARSKQMRDVTNVV